MHGLANKIVFLSLVAALYLLDLNFDSPTHIGFLIVGSFVATGIGLDLRWVNASPHRPMPASAYWVFTLSLVYLILAVIIFSSIQTASFSPRSSWYFFLLNTFWAAVFEEIIFRFYLIRYLVRLNLSLSNSLLISGIIFMLIHGGLNASHLWSATVFGLVFILTQSVAASVAVHLTQNLVVSFFKQGPDFPIILVNLTPANFDAEFWQLAFIRTLQAIVISVCVFRIYRSKTEDHLAFLRR